MIALKDTPRAARLYRPVARRQSVRKARNRAVVWSLLTFLAAVYTLAVGDNLSMVIFVLAFLGLSWRLVCWQDVAQRKWERENEW